MKKELVDEKVTRHNGSRDAIPTPTNCPSCGRGSGCVSEASYNHRGGVFGLNNRNGNPPTLTLPFRWGGNLGGNSDTPQSLISSNHFTHFTHLTHLTHFKKAAFTLAETLITLAVIGIVAAMTIPILVTNYQKKATETKLRRFYATMTNAIRLEEAEIGSITTWLPDGGNGETFEHWYNNHLDKHIKSLSIKPIDYTDNLTSPTLKTLVALADGSGFVGLNTEYPTDHGNYAHFFYCTEVKECGVNKMDGKKSFLFSLIAPGKFVPSMFESQDKTREELLESCKYGNFDDPEVSTPGKRHDCALLIMRDGWEIKNDYPWEQVILPQK